MEKNEQELKRQFQLAVNSYKDDKIEDLIRKQWEKSKKFDFEVNPANLVQI